ncbi:MAG: Papain-like cysteine protease AvrRpt2 [Acidobacteriota bacterium]|jgi:hypothetical protein|nr:Papain-like cysteine protease AvrRpt2 [Acidobacteriota bacterium]
MSLQRTQAEIRPLKFDPTPQNARDSFAWAIDHEDQEQPDWCWGACLSNALSCFGSYVDQKEIVAKFQLDHDISPDATDRRIPSPEDMVALWRSYGFGAELAPPLSYEALAREIITRGPVQIELWWDDNPGVRHLALIFGLRQGTNGPEVAVSDPLSLAPEWYPYEVMRGPNPLQESDFGKWQRSYVGLEYQRGYLRRFFGCPSKFLAELGPEEVEGTDGPALPPVQAVISQLALDPPPSPHPSLTYELALATYGYRRYRYRSAPDEKKEARLADLRRRLFLFESIQLWRPPSEIDYGSPLSGQVQFHRWHHQIHGAGGRPRYFAQSCFLPKLGRNFERGWRTTWIGERWMAERVNNAIRKMDSDFGDRHETARLVLFRREGLVTLELPASGIHVIVSAPKEQEKVFPLLEVLTDEQLRGALGEQSQPAEPETAVA